MAVCEIVHLPVSTRHRDHSKKVCDNPDGGPARDLEVQASGCSECLPLLWEGIREIACSQGEGLLTIVADLKEEVERLMSIMESMKEIAWWSNSLLCQREEHWGNAPQRPVEPPPCQAEGEDQKDRRAGSESQFSATGNPLPTYLASPGAPL